jgi:vacuolar-type H+-ATPase subunit I/STV1
MSKPRTRKMVNLAIEETSGVDHPAHLHEGWLVMKSASESEVQRVLDKSLTKEDSTMEDMKTTEATEDKVEKTVEEELAMAQARIAELEAKLAEKELKPEEEVVMAMDEDSKKPEEETMKMDSEKKEEEEEYLKSAPRSVVKMITDLKKQADAATAELRKERIARADAQAVEKAKGWANLNINAEKVGPALRRLSETDSELAKSVEEILSSVNAQAESASIFAEIGKSADFKSGNAYERMTTLAKSAVEEGVAKSFAQAMADVASKNPDLYSQYLSEKGA